MRDVVASFGGELALRDPVNKSVGLCESLCQRGRNGRRVCSIVRTDRGFNRGVESVQLFDPCGLFGLRRVGCDACKSYVDAVEEGLLMLRGNDTRSLEGIRVGGQARQRNGDTTVLRLLFV